MPEISENLVSTIIPVFNRPKLLIDAVHSALSQTYRPIEIIISDDGSTDDTLEVSKNLSSQFPSIIRVISNSKQGPGPTREVGRLISKGEYIQYLDSDDRLLPNKLSDQMSALKSHPECDVAYGITRLTELSGKVLSAPYKWTGVKTDTLFPKLLIDRWWCTHTPLYRRSICDKVGPWSDLKYSQDWEYDARVGGQNAKLLFIDKIVSEHRTHHSERQTGKNAWLLPKDRVRFFRSLFTNALKAKVSIDCPEMKHFSRWAFLNARQCGKMGDAIASEACFELAVRSDNKKSNDLEFYRLLARYFGWNFLGRFFCWFDQMLKRKPSPATMKQSWMD